MNNLNVFSYGCTKRYYITHPWRFIKETGQNLRAAWHRATLGYAYRDVWELGPHLLEILPPMLRHLEKYHCGTPYNMTDEEWTQWLHNMANSIERLQEEKWDEQNEYADAFFRVMEEKRIKKRNEHDTLTITWSDEPDEKEISKKYFARCEELNKQWDVEAEKVFKDLSSMLPALWD